MFIEFNWQNSITSLLIAVNAVLDNPSFSAPINKWSISNIEKLSASLQEGSYQPNQWFNKVERSSVLQIEKIASSIELDNEYNVLCLSIEPSGLEMLSSRSGGVLFEDPFYALLASFNIGYFKKPWVEVRVSSREQAWEQRLSIIDKLRDGSYYPKSYFQLVTSAPFTEINKIPISTHSITGKDLVALEFNGMTTAHLDSGLGRLYLLYRYVAP